MIHNPMSQVLIAVLHGQDYFNLVKVCLGVKKEDMEILHFYLVMHSSILMVIAIKMKRNKTFVAT